MSEQYPGGWVTKSPPAPTGPYDISAAPGIWNMTQQAQYKVQGIWPTQGNSAPIYWIMSIAPPVAGGYTTIGTQAGNPSSIDSSGNIYTALSMGPKSGPYYAAWNIAKLSKNGTITWTYSYTWDGTDTGYLGNPQFGPSGDLLVSGYTGQSPYYGFAGKFNTSGASQWNVQTTAASYPLLTLAGYDSSNNLYWAGQNDSNLNGVWAKTDNSGSVSASIRINNNTHNYSYFNTAYVNSSGTFLGAGTTIYEGFLTRITNTGSVSWYTTLGTGYGGTLVNMTVDPSFSYMYTVAKFPGVSDWSLYKVDATNGTSVPWSKYSSDFPYYYGAMACDSSGNLYCVTVPNASSKTLAILKFNSSGTLQWQRAFSNVSSNLNPTNISIDNTNSAFVLMFGISSSPTRAGVVRLPLDGSQTGTYGDWTYATSSYTINSGASGSWSSAGYTTSSGVSTTSSSPTITATAFTATTTKIA